MPATVLLLVLPGCGQSRPDRNPGFVSYVPATSRALSDRGGYLICRVATLPGALPCLRAAARYGGPASRRWWRFRSIWTPPNARQTGEELLSVINGGATVLIADMTATIWCDHAGADAVVRAFQRAVVRGTELRLVVAAQHVSRVFSLSGLRTELSRVDCGRWSVASSHLGDDPSAWSSESKEERSQWRGRSELPMEANDEPG